MKIRQKQLSALVSVAMISLYATSNAQAGSCGNNYSVAVTVNAVTNCVGSTTAQGFFNLINTNTGLQAISSQYTNTSAAQVQSYFNSVPINLSVAANSTTLVLNIPALGIVNQQFTGATRADSSTLLENYLKHQNNIIGQILQYQAATSPTSPISGPGGLIQTVTSGDFNSNFTNNATQIAAPKSVATSESKKSSNLAGVALQYGSYDTLGNKITTATLPLSYTIRNDMDPRRQLSFDLPITQVQTNGATSYQIGLGASYRFPINDNWTLTPAGKYSIVGSADLAAAATLYSATLTSTYIWNLNNYDVAMGNMVGLLKTGHFNAGDYSVDPGISNTAFRNGLMLSQPVSLGGSKLSVEYSVIDTRYTGSSMYVNGTDEIGITLGTNKSAFSARSYLRGGISYISGKDTKGFTVNLGYWF